jgi:hypothetical protein
MQTSSTEDVLWPLVAAAVAGTRIHLQNRHAHYLHLFADGEAGSWSREFFVNSMLKIGCNRLLGLGSRHSKLDVVPVSAQSAFAQAFRDSHHESRQEDLQRAEDEEVSTDVLVWWKLSYANFQVGRDGEACLEQKLDSRDSALSGNDDRGIAGRKQKSWNTPGERVCLMRPYRYIALRGYGSRGRGCHAGPNLSLFLRGPFFGDPFYSLELPHEILYLPNNIMAAPVAWNSSWMAAQNAFVYNVRLCQ